MTASQTKEGTTAEAATEGALGIEIERERLRVLVGNAVGGTIGNIALATCMSLALWGPAITPRWWIVLWLCAHSAHALVRTLLARRWVGLVASVPSPARYSKLLALHSTIGSVSWALMLSLFVDFRTPYPATIAAMTVYCLIIGAQGTTRAYFPGYVASIVALLLGVFLRCLFIGGPLAVILCSGVSFFAMVLISTGRRADRAWVTAFRASKTNEALAAKLAEQKARAERADAAKTRFLAAASHDLRQPLHAQALFIAALARLDAGEGVAMLTERISASHQAMKKLLDAILDISRLDADAVKPALCSFPLSELFEQLGSELTEAAAAKGLELRVVETSAWVRSDPLLVLRVLRNLVTNAIRYTERGRVVLGAKRDGARLRLIVADSGIGIPADAHETVFEEFVQLHNPERDRGQGIGLGLAIVRRLARLLGAELSLQSTVGKGTAFSLWLPRAEPPRARPFEERARPPVSAQVLAGKRLLIVDDEALVLAGMRSFLETLPCVVHVATSGDEALALVAGGTPIDGVIVDYRLHGDETGTSVVERLRAALSPGLPAVIVTGDTAPDRIRDATAFGLPLLHKPVQTQLLVETLAALLASPGG